MNEPKVAERWKRLLAAIADLVLVFGSLLLMVVVSPDFGVSSENEANFGAIGVLALVIVQMALLVKRGQSLGKLIFKIRIVDHKTYQNPGFMQTGIVRSSLYAFSITIIVPLFDYLWIFRKGNRCLHDLMSGTIVICD